MKPLLGGSNGAPWYLGMTPDEASTLSDPQTQSQTRSFETAMAFHTEWEAHAWVARENKLN